MYKRRFDFRRVCVRERKRERVFACVRRREMFWFEKEILYVRKRKSMSEKERESVFVCEKERNVLV